MRVLVLGCGPAGLIAANAALTAGAEVAILSKRRKSFMKGAQYLHAPVSGVMSKRFTVTYDLWGSPESYRFKVYGRTWDGSVSPEDLAQTHDAWDIRVAYDQLWDRMVGGITDWEATPAGLHMSIKKIEPDLVVSTIPAPLLCSKGHTFRAQKIWSTDRVWIPEDRDNFVICNGKGSPAWYRASRIQGWENTEWSGQMKKPPLNPIWEVTKPTDNNCDCWPDVMRGGRYGRWEKGVLSHEIELEVFARCDSILSAQS